MQALVCNITLMLHTPKFIVCITVIAESFLRKVWSWPGFRQMPFLTDFEFEARLQVYLPFEARCCLRRSWLQSQHVNGGQFMHG